MIITKKHIPRRTFLRGVGVTLALPMLESMLPAQTPIRQTAAGPVRRFVGIWHPHGVAPGYFSPVQEGSNFEFSFVTKPLESVRDRVVLISGLDCPEANPTADEPGGDHARGAVLLSGARPRRNLARSPVVTHRNSRGDDRSRRGLAVAKSLSGLVAAQRLRTHRTDALRRGRMCARWAGRDPRLGVLTR